MNRNIGLELIWAMVKFELSHAREVFPSNRHMLTVLNEEVGELNKAMLDYEYNKCDKNEIITEAIQTIAMVVRLLQEGDPNFKYEP
jgi:hypothetical protein